jgi:kynurenine formamidase
VWGEGPVYERSTIYAIEDPAPPPVNYDAHLLRPHSVTHAESPGHVVAGGARLDPYLDAVHHFHGPALVGRLPAGGYRDAEDGTRVQEVPADVLAPHLEGHDDAAKILLTADDTPVDADGFHAADHPLVLAEDAAQLLLARPRFDLFGTSYRSTDHRPGSAERPIHRALFERAVLLEYLDLRGVPAGRYLLVAFPVRLAGATEAPVTPVLFTPDELGT